MKKIILFILSFIFSTLIILSDEIKVYDELGNRVGTYKKINDKYEFYDFYERKIEDPSSVIKNAPDQNTLKNYSQEYKVTKDAITDMYINNSFSGRYRRFDRGFIQPKCWYNYQTPSIVRPSAKTNF